VKNILLQHYNGQLSDLAKASMENMKQYASYCGAEYRLITGEPVGAIMSISNKSQLKKVNACHKVHMLNPEFDEYDVVAMIDPDMFVRRGLSRNIFEDETGVGICSDHIRANAFARFRNAFPQYSSKINAFWGGAIWRLDRDMRKRLRKQWNVKEVMRIGSTIFVDEGIMHNLSRKANIPDSPEYILDQKWCWCSYLPKSKNAYMIHMRKTDSKGNKVTKEQSLKRLQNEGIV